LERDLAMGRKFSRFLWGLLVPVVLLVSSCLSRETEYDLATGRSTLPDWRIISHARARYGPYVKWKIALMKELTDGSSILYTKMGPVEYRIDGDRGPFLLIVHGGPGGYDQTNALFRDMLGKGFRVISFSRPGYLRTPIQDGRTFTEQADLAAELLDNLHIGKAAVLGYSAGGPVAIELASRHPDRVWALILECAVTRKWTVSPDNLQEKIFFGYLMYSDPFLWASDITGKLAPRLVGMSTIEMESSLDRSEEKKLVASIMKDERRQAVLRDMVKSMSPEELREEGMNNDVDQLKKIRELPLAGIRVPALIVHGARDADVPVENARYASTMIPGSELFIVKDGFHVMILTDSANEITARRVSFLKKHAPEQGKYGFDLRKATE
jgi:pimeloyl-ACP methyl ester carboxylesterase